MKTSKLFILLPAFILPALIQLPSFAQGVIKTESGARIVSTTGSYWVVKNGSFALTSQSAANPAVMANLKIEPSASLTVEPQSYLTVTGALSNTSGNDGLFVKSGGSLIQNTTGVPGTVERAIPAGEWHLVSAPVSDAVSGMFTGYFLQKHTESTNVYTDIIPANVPLTPMQGFALFGNAGLPTAIYSGTLNTGAESFSTTYSGVGKGWNLVGNPYSSSIDWNAASGWIKTNVNASVYLHVNNAAWATWNGAIGTNGGSRYIASGQGFFVEATANGVLSMNNSVKVHNAATFFKNSRETVNNMIRLEVSGNGYADEGVVWFVPEATAGFDGEYDAHKLYGDVAGAAQIFSLGGVPLAINVLPETSAVPVGIRAGATGTYTITATEIHDFTEVTLEDTKTAIFTNMLNDSYTFNFAPGENELRFVLHFGPLPVKEKENPVAHIYSYQQTVYIDMKEQAGGEVFIYSLSGQLIATAMVTHGINRIGLVTTGVYIVKLLTDKMMMVKKVWIE